MSTLIVPPVPPSPRDDAIELYRAFKGTLSLSLFKTVGDDVCNMLVKLLLEWIMGVVICLKFPLSRCSTTIFKAYVSIALILPK